MGVVILSWHIGSDWHICPVDVIFSWLKSSYSQLLPAAVKPAGQQAVNTTPGRTDLELLLLMC